MKNGENDFEPANGAASAAAGPLAWLYGGWAWSAFIVCALTALACAILLPGTARRRRWVTRCARLPFRLAGIPTSLRGLEHLPEGPCVVVANHASYLDGVILQAFLPPRFSYVIKGEMQQVPVVGALLRRIGARFVDRHSAGGSARDARTLLKAADAGESLAFFPEGTFTEVVGLAAFRAAQRAGLPVVPVVIRGARRILPAGRVLPRRAPLTIDILEALPADAAPDSRALATLVRRQMLPVLGEPDLTARAG